MLNNFFTENSICFASSFEQILRFQCPLCPFTSETESVLLVHVNSHFEVEQPEYPPAADNNEHGDKKTSDIDDKTTLTSSIIPRLFNDSTPGVSRILIDADIDHYGYSAYDNGWGCGYRNLQMILSSVFQVNSDRI